MNTNASGDTLQVTVTVRNLEPGQHHQMVVLNLIDADEEAIYDSHKLDEDIDFVIEKDQTKGVGPFEIKIPGGAKPGLYTLLVGYREYPWEPLIAFQGATWCPPVGTIRIR